MSKEPDRSQRKALGKGLSALLPARSKVTEIEPAPVASATPPEETQTQSSEGLQTLPITQISPGEGQPRTTFEDEKLAELAQSIRSNGLLQPITVYRAGDHGYKIVAGERRWRAAQLAGLTEIPALVKQVPQERLLEIALIENIQREDLNPVEIALAFQALQSDHGLTHEDIAERTGKDRSTVSNFLRLLRLPPEVRDDLAHGRISMGHAKALLNVPFTASQVALSKEIQEKHLSVRDVEERAKTFVFDRKNAPAKKAANAPEPLDPNVRAALDDLSQALGTKVKIVPRNSQSGRIEIEYYSQDDLDRIYSAIVKD